MSEIDLEIERLKNIFDTSLEGVVIADIRQEDEPVIYCNSMFTSMTGYEPNEILGKNCRFLQGEDRNQPGSYIIRSALSAKQPCKVVLKNYRKDGSLFFNRLSMFPVKDDQNSVTHYIGIQDDITDIIQTRDRLYQSEQDKETLLAEIHHRVKNNLAVISAMLDLESFNEYKPDAIEKSKMRIKSMALIHEDIYQLDGLSKIRFDDYIMRFVEYIKIEYNDRSPELNYLFDLDEVVLTANQAVPLAIAVGELIQNVYKHAFPNRKKGFLSIRLDEKSDRVILKISDNGVGLKGEFNPATIESTGWLISLQSLTQIGATITADPTQPGTDFTIKFEKKVATGASQHRKIFAESI